MAAKDQYRKTKLGIDAKWFFEGPPSGNVVVKNLVDEIVKSGYQGFELYLFINRRHKNKAKSYFPTNVNLVFLPYAPNLLSNLFIIPVAAAYHRIEIMLFQNFTSFWPGKLYKIAYVHDVLFLDFPQYYTPSELAYFKNMQFLAKKADMIITISLSEKMRMVNNNVAGKEKINVVYHGINESFKRLSQYTRKDIISIIDKYSLPDRYLLYVGRINIRKNLMSLIRALNLIDDQNIPLIIVGKIDLIIKKEIEGTGLVNKIVFTGHVPAEDLYLIYAKATVFCFPSFAEGFGLPPLEAMQCGVPVIVSNKTAMPEICGNGAVYINPDDAQDIAQKLNSLLNNLPFYKQKIIDGLNRAAEFSWNKSAGEILTLISNAYVN